MQNIENESLEDTKGYKLAISFKPFINPKCTEHMEIVKGMAMSINRNIKEAKEDNRNFHHGYDKGKEWQKEKDKIVIDKLVAFIEEMAQRYGASEWIAGEANKLLNSIKL